MHRQLRRVAWVVAIVLCTAIVTLNTTVVRKHHHRLEEEHYMEVKELVLGKNSTSESSFGDKLTELDVFSEMIASDTDDSGLREAPALTRDVQDNQIEREEIPNSSTVIPERFSQSPVCVHYGTGRFIRPSPAVDRLPCRASFCDPKWCEV